ncbi:MAG: hypothetical protein AAGA88_06460 [Pseudomonadota bacterium]
MPEKLMKPKRSWQVPQRRRFNGQYAQTVVVEERSLPTEDGTHLSDQQLWDDMLGAMERIETVLGPRLDEWNKTLAEIGADIDRLDAEGLERERS